jgi:hemoglobin/transferrin/lactoferrin receptor protein
MSKLFKPIVFPILILLAWQVFTLEEVQAQDIETRAVTVTSTRSERDLFNIPMTVGVKNSEDLKWQPATNIADFVQDLPGLQIMDGGMPGGKRIMIRGESPMRSLILIDGVKISEQKSMSGPAILVDTSQIERIEVIKGPASVLYGSEAIGGVINIITKKGGDKPISFSQNFIADSSTHSVNWQTAIFGSYNGFNYRFSGSGLNALERRATSGTIDNSKYKNNYITGRVGYDWDNGSVYVRADKYHSVIHIPSQSESGNILGPAPTYAVYGNITTVELDLPKWDRQSISAGVELRNLLPYLTKLRLDLYYQNLKKDFKNKIYVNNYNFSTGAYLSTMLIGVNTLNNQDSLGGSIQSDWKLRDHYLIFGLDYNKDDLKADDNRAPTIRRTPYIVIEAMAAASYHYKAEQSTFGLYAQDEWSLPNNFTATLGLRNTWVKSSLKANDNPALPNNSSKTDSKLVANVGLVYTGLDNISLRASWAQGYKFPPLNDLYLGTVHGQDGRTLPNPNLNPETSNNFEIGLRFNNGALNIDLAAFYSKSRNYITTAPAPGTDDDDQFVNTDSAKTFGLELGTSYEIDSLGLTPYATVTYIDRKITDTIQTKHRDLSAVPITPYFTEITYSTSNTGTPPWFGRFGFKFDRDLNNSLIFHSNVYLEWATSAKRTNYDNTFMIDNGSGNANTLDFGFSTEKLNGWHTYNVDFGLEWGEEHKWNASLSLRNIFDHEYTRSLSATEDPGFHVVGAVGFEY